MKLNGAQLLLKCLLEEDANIIFGYPGGTVLPIYDALHDTPEITHILTAHEQGATHAADGYARSTGKVGVVVATSGPGATNTVTGIATAFRDSIPLVVITGQVAQPLIGKDSFQEVDIRGITLPITKKSFSVTRAEKLPYIVKEAFKTARSGRPGPVLIDIPKDVQSSVVDYMFIEEHEISVLKEVSADKNNCEESTITSIEKFVELIESCKRPLIYAGGGVTISGASSELIEFAEKIKSPVSCSLMGLGAFPGDHRYFMGMIGMHGTRYSNYAVSQCDLLIAIGARFSDRVVSKVDSFAQGAKIVHIDIDSKEFGKNVRTDLAICGDVKEILQVLNKKVRERNEDEWNDQVNDWKKVYPLKCKQVGSLSPQNVLNKLCDLTKGDAIITTEVGQNQIWTAQYYKFLKPRSFVSSGGLGTMGFGLGAAIGSAIANPNKKVINVAGDGSFKMNSTELATVAKYRLPIVQLVLNNNALGMVKQWQDLFFQGKFSHTVLGPDVDFIKLAEAYGIKAFRINNDDEIEDVLKMALEMNEPVVVECIINENEMVYPIVPPGAALTEIID
jgi:acetolactate synthase I/II/III large subunit